MPRARCVDSEPSQAVGSPCEAATGPPRCPTTTAPAWELPPRPLRACPPERMPRAGSLGQRARCCAYTQQTGRRRPPPRGVPAVPSSRPVLHTAPCFLEDLNLTRKRPACPGGLVASILSLLTGSVRLPLEGCSFFLHEKVATPFGSHGFPRFPSRGGPAIGAFGGTIKRQSSDTFRPSKRN